MNISSLIKQIWEKFAALFDGQQPQQPQNLEFARVVEGTNWRIGAGLWSGLLSVFTTRVYYLEISRTSLADRRELNLKPAPTHTFKLFYFRKTEVGKVRVTVFLIYLNCYLAGNSEDFIAVEVLGKVLASHIKILSSQSYSGGSDLAQSQIVKSPGQLPQVKVIQSNQGIPTVILLGQSTAQTLAYWQEFIISQMAVIKAEQDSQARRRGFG